MTPKLGTHDVFCPSKEGPTSLPLCIIVQNAVNIVFKWGPKRGFPEFIFLSLLLYLGGQVVCSM
jgi:hypothetical protein